MPEKRNVFLVCAVIAALLSLPTTWMTIHGAQIQEGPGMMLNSTFGGLNIDVTDPDVHVTLLINVLSGSLPVSPPRQFCCCRGRTAVYRCRQFLSGRRPVR